MAKILADRDIKQLVGRVLIDANEKLLNPNGIELRLGKLRDRTKEIALEVEGRDTPTVDEIEALENL